MRIPGVESGSINGKDRDPLHYFVEIRGLEPNIRQVSVQKSIRRVGPAQLIGNWPTRTIRSGI